MASRPVGHSADAAKNRSRMALLQSVTLAFRTGDTELTCRARLSPGGTRPQKTGDWRLSGVYCPHEEGLCCNK